jgi:hypothetical protein
MGGKKDRARVIERVTWLEGGLRVNSELQFHLRFLAAERDGRAAVHDLYRQAGVELRRVAGHVEQFCFVYQPSNQKIHKDALQLGMACTQLLDMQIVALDLCLGGLSLLRSVDGDDFEYLLGVIRTAESVFSSHVSFVRSVLRCERPELLAFQERYRTGGGAAAPPEEFLSLYRAGFPEFRRRVLMQASDWLTPTG